jgi:dolichol-phosphate mannosyltransferase
MSEKKPVVSIVLPTYNERENIGQIVAAIGTILEDAWQHEVIVVDDGSPDGTGELVRRLAENDPAVRLLERPHKLGLGSAVAAGFSMATGDYWVMMDADLSHRPQDLPPMLQGLADADITVGSRYIPGGGTQGWPLQRQIFSRAAGLFARLFVGLPIRDATSGFAAFRRDTLEPLLPTLRPEGFKLLLEILVKAPEARVTEVPITFVERQRGQSKLSLGESLKFFKLCWDLRNRSDDA